MTHRFYTIVHIPEKLASAVNNDDDKIYIMAEVFLRKHLRASQAKFRSNPEEMTESILKLTFYKNAVTSLFERARERGEGRYE